MLNVVIGLVCQFVPVTNAPADRDILRALPPSAGVPGVFEPFRDDVVIVKNVLWTKRHEPRVFPVIGPARLTETHWECLAYYTETVRIGFPFAVEVKKQKVQAVYIDTQALRPAVEK